MMIRQVPPNGTEPAKSEDDIQRELLGPRGVPGAPDPAKMSEVMLRYGLVPMPQALTP